MASILKDARPHSQSRAPEKSRAIVLSEIEAMGGAERSVLALSRWLLGRGLPHYFLTYMDHIGLADHAGHPITVVELRPSMRAAKKISALRRHFAGQTGPAPLMSSYQPVLHATLAGLRGFHCLLHDTPSLLHRDIPRTLAWRMRRWTSDQIAGRGLKSGGQTIVTSEYLRDEASRVFGIDAQIARMGGLFGVQKFTRRRVSGTLRLLSVSRIEANKRIDWMIRALAVLEKQETPPLSSRVNWSLDIAGSGSQLVSLQALARAVGLEDRVKFLGYVSDEQIEALYAKAHLFLMPAVQGYGIPAIEALSRGLPILLHRDSGVSDILLETPWATVIRGQEEGMLPGLRQAIQIVCSGAHHDHPPPALPTESGWAERVSTLCGWA